MADDAPLPSSPPPVPSDRDIAEPVGQPGAWRWVPSLYFAEGIPYMVVAVLSVLLYKRLGLTNTDIALYTSWLYLPWVIKPFWAPLVEMIKTKRLWIVAMQVLIGGGLAGVALTIPASGFVQAIDTEAVGVGALVLGAGRETKESEIDPAVGLEVKAKLGDEIQVGDPLVGEFVG